MNGLDQTVIISFLAGVVIGMFLMGLLALSIMSHANKRIL